MPPTARATRMVALMLVAVTWSQVLWRCPRVWTVATPRISTVAPSGTTCAATHGGSVRVSTSENGPVRYVRARVETTAVGAANPRVNVAHPDTKAAPRPYASRTNT